MELDSESEEDFYPSWYPYDDGATVGKRGPTHGYISRDEEFGDPGDDEDADARLTLEQGSVENPGFFLTATLYGWMYHTHRAENEVDAQAKWAGMLEALERLADMLPYEEDRKKVEDKTRAMNDAIADYELAFPSAGDK